MNTDKRSGGGTNEEREDLIGEHPMGDGGQIVLFLLFLAIWVADSFFLKYSTFLTQYASPYIRIPLAVLILVFSAYLARSGLGIVFGEKREKPEVIRKGVFNIVRHPIYLSALLFYVALLVASFSLLAFAVWIVTVLFYIYISRYEEKLLKERFGKDYEEYMKEVPMLFPKIRS
ncbi:MAG: isoprenylcysteine carboxylmethyltransferase family protein [Bacteroidota bacterium]